jgi:hypothetical protein
MNIIQEIIGNAGNRNVINIQFVPFDKEKQQIEGAFKLGQLNLVGCGISHIVN